MEIAPGVRIGAFEIRAAVGAGGMGSVYRAHDTKLARDVAIKILQDRHSERPDYLRRFEREARAASALNHPNIVTVFEINEVDGSPYIAMELIEGPRIRDLLYDGPVPLRKLLKIATQVADGLAAAHDRGIVHRDIKPENVMITRQGLVKILDFGLARPDGPATSVDSNRFLSETITCEIERGPIGTAGYMSPEQAAGKSIDYRSDQFSLGALLYEMTTGRRAFHDTSIAGTIHAIIHDDPVPIRRLNPKAPEPLCWIIDRCLAKDPADRYASTTDLARELHTLLERLPDTGSDATRLQLAVPSARPFAFAAAAVVITMAIVAATAMWRRGEPATSPAADAHVAILPFEDRTGRPGGTQFSRGLAQAMTARLQRYSAIQVLPPTSSAPLIAEGANEDRIAQELGVSWILKATVERIGDALKVHYTLVDAKRDRPAATDTVSGSADDVWALQDAVAAAVAMQLGLEKTRQQTTTVADQAELETSEEQDLYLRALGHLVDQHEHPAALDGALSLLRELLETASDSPLVHAALARTYLEKYNLTKESQWTERAAQASDRARALAPNSPEVLLAQATVQQFTARFDDAIATFKRALVLQPSSPEAVLGLAKSYYGAGQIEDAERTFVRAVRLRPSWWSSHNELGVLYLNRGRYDDAARKFEKVIELNPASPWGFTNLGVVHVTRERLPEAVAAFTKALALRDDPAAWANLGYCHYYLGDYEKSAHAYRKAAEQRPKRATYWANLADACRWTPTCRDEVSAAIARATDLLHEELALNPKSARANATLAVCLAQIGRHKEADERIRMALQLEPENPARMFQAGRVANLNGSPTEAVTWFRRALDRGFGRFELPRDPEFESLRKSEPYHTAFSKPPNAT